MAKVGLNQCKTHPFFQHVTYTVTPDSFCQEPDTRPRELGSIAKSWIASSIPRTLTLPPRSPHDWIHSSTTTTIMIDRSTRNSIIVPVVVGNQRGQHLRPRTHSRRASETASNCQRLPTSAAKSAISKPSDRWYVPNAWQYEPCPPPSPKPEDPFEGTTTHPNVVAVFSARVEEKWDGTGEMSLRDWHMMPASKKTSAADTVVAVQLEKSLWRATPGFLLPAHRTSPKNFYVANVPKGVTCHHPAESASSSQPSSSSSDLKPTLIKQPFGTSPWARFCIHQKLSLPSWQWTWLLSSATVNSEEQSTHNRLSTCRATNATRTYPIYLLNVPRWLRTLQHGWIQRASSHTVPAWGQHYNQNASYQRHSTNEANIHCTRASASVANRGKPHATDEAAGASLFDYTPNPSYSNPQTFYLAPEHSVCKLSMTGVHRSPRRIDFQRLVGTDAAVQHLLKECSPQICATAPRTYFILCAHEAQVKMILSCRSLEDPTPGGGEQIDAEAQGEQVSVSCFCHRRLVWNIADRIVHDTFGEYLECLSLIVKIVLCMFREGGGEGGVVYHSNVGIFLTTFSWHRDMLRFVISWAKRQLHDAWPPTTFKITKSTDTHGADKTFTSGTINSFDIDFENVDCWRRHSEFENQISATEQEEALQDDTIEFLVKVTSLRSTWKTKIATAFTFRAPYFTKGVNAEQMWNVLLTITIKMIERQVQNEHQ